MSGTPKRPVRILLVEDSADDAELLLLELRRAGFEPFAERVFDTEALREALKRPWDVILSDYTMPRFSALEALKLVEDGGQDIPFIVVSGSVGEDTAVEMMRAGASDFFAKGSIRRLGAAIHRELRDAEVRHERGKAHRARREAEERFRLFIKGVKDYAIYVLDRDGRVASWNEGAAEQTGYSVEEAIGKPFSCFFPESAVEAGTPDELLRRAWEEGFCRDESARRRRDGSRLVAESVVSTLRDDAGGFAGYACITHDVTQRERMIGELRDAVRARDDFLAIASHELKTPLTSLFLQIQSVQRHIARTGQALPPDVLRGKFEIMARQSERLSLLIETLLDVSRITSHRMDLYRRDISFTKIVERVVERMRDAITASGCEVALRLEPVAGYWDALRLESIVTNLLSNALKFGHGKPVELSLSVRGDHASFSVTDHGIGISAEDQARIFERFERAVSKEHYGGFGIGLWLVRQIVDAHGGRVRVESELGAGSTFTVELPLKALAGAEPAPTQSPSP